MKYIIFLSFIVLPLFSNAQEFRGGEITLIHQGNNKYHVKTDIYFQALETIDKPFIPMDYSYGTKDTALLMSHQFLPNDIQLLSYLDSFTMPGIGSLYTITALDTFLLPELNNLGGDNDFFVLKTKIYVSISFSENNLPTFNSVQTDIDNFDGVLVHDLLMEDPDGDDLEYEFNDFSDVNGYVYTLPEADEEIFITEEGKLIWSRPVEDGKYLIGFLIHEYFPNSNFLLSTTKRTMIIDTEADFMTTTSNLKNVDNFNVFPNPTSSTLNYSIKGINPSKNATIQLIDPFGKTVLQQKGQLESEGSIEVNHLPTGIYFLQITTQNQTYTKKVIIQQGR